MVTEDSQEYLASKIEDLAEEIRRLQALQTPMKIEALTEEIRRLQALQTPMTRYRWLRRFVKDLETNPYKQYRVHQIGVYWWLLNFPLIVLLYFLAPGLWLDIGILITLIYSVYANFATDYGAMSAAMAAYGKEPMPAIPLEPPSSGR